MVSEWYYNYNGQSEYDKKNHDAVYDVAVNLALFKFLTILLGTYIELPHRYKYTIKK